MAEDTLAARLKFAREKSGISQSKLGRLVGISPQAIQSLESGNSAGSKYLAEIAGTLGVEATWLATGEGKMARRPRRDISEPSLSEPADDLEFFLEEESADDGSLPPVRTSYNPAQVPVFVCESLRRARMPKKAKEELQETIFEWVHASNSGGDVPKKVINDLCKYPIFYVTGNSPDDYVPRPHYLNGQVEAYAVYINDSSSISTLNINHSIALVSPHKRPDFGDVVLVWHKSNTFFVSKLAGETPDNIMLEHSILRDKMINEPDFEKALEMTTTITLDKSQIKSIHTVMGLEFGTPRTPKVRVMRPHPREGDE
ncbi:helix-turn-helix transcriptional regulator [Gluconacetobacter diazotrophicus]|uniref:Helix-turn-helix transcriptional regulator n=1 Tax=Gluconacetobacter diazotrophicus TaxID=33996 RepID=A0A7W4NKQ8_GLUDI|nr:helix-turn-helix transcriptional regulator [Gluconacetobacter diazotrophicus]MBB2157033.1 helix-turn-helix transcriptional regulator [Gluconacetobacter diazotrophicus]